MRCCEAASGLHAFGTPSLVELAVRNALAAVRLSLGLADARLAGTSWAELMNVVLWHVASG